MRLKPQPLTRVWAYCGMPLNTSVVNKLGACCGKPFKPLTLLLLHPQAPCTASCNRGIGNLWASRCDAGCALGRAAVAQLLHHASTQTLSP